MDELSTHISEEDVDPFLFPGVIEILEIWHARGSPAAKFGGLASGIIDRRPELYVARIAWMNEQGLEDPQTRDLLMLLLDRLDTEKLSIEFERMRNAAEEAKG